MKTTKEQTHTPWEVIYIQDQKGKEIGMEIGKAGDPNITVARLDSESPLKVQIENAELIVRAVNSHKALLKALCQIAKTAKIADDPGHVDNDMLLEKCDEIEIMASEAIAKAIEIIPHEDVEPRLILRHEEK